MEKEKKYSIILHSIFGVCFIALLILASFKDLEISHNLSNGKSFFGLLFAMIGEYPSYLIPPGCGIIFFAVAKANSVKANKIVFCSLAIVLMFIGWVLLCLKSHKPFELKNWAYYAIAISVLLTAICVLLGVKLTTKTANKLVYWAFFALIVLITALIVIQLAKLFWGRMRYRDMLAENSFKGFTAWFLPQGIRSGDFTSFPSGHTNSATCMFVLVPLVEIFYKKKSKKYTTIAVAVLFTLLTAVSRIVYNAHFLSDVLFGGIIGYAIYYVYYKTLWRKMCLKKSI